MRGYDHMGFIGHGFGFGWIFEIFFIFIIIFWLISLFRYHKGNGCCSGDNHSKDGSGDDEALAILKKRYAKGEINKEQFEEMKKELKK